MAPKKWYASSCDITSGRNSKRNLPVQRWANSLKRNSFFFSSSLCFLCIIVDRNNEKHKNINSDQYLQRYFKTCTAAGNFLRYHPTQTFNAVIWDIKQWNSGKKSACSENVVSFMLALVGCSMRERGTSDTLLN